MERIKMAVVSRTVEMALRPAARIVSPDSTSCQHKPVAYMEMKTKLTNEIDNAVCNAQRAGSLYTATDILDVSVKLLSCLLALELSEVNLGEVGETGANALSNQ